MRLAFPSHVLAITTAVVSAACARNDPQSPLVVDQGPGLHSQRPKGGGNDDRGSSSDASINNGRRSSEDSAGRSGTMWCSEGEECTDPAAPLCDSMIGQCVSCDELADGDVGCAELDPTAPLCVGDACGQCRDNDTQVCQKDGLVCDTTTNACVPCTEHEQCGEAACNLFDGRCLPADAALHVGSGQPLATIADAVAMVAPGGAATVVVHGNDSFDESVTVDSERTVVFLANDGDRPQWLASGAGAPQLTVAESTVLLDGPQILGNGATVDPGVLARNGRLWADCGRTVANFGGGILTQGAAELVLRNWFVGGPFVESVSDFSCMKESHL